MSTLPEWPKLPDVVYADNCFPPAAQEKLRHERAWTDAAMSRLRIAVTALKQIDQGALSDTDMLACKALEQIGDLPEE